MTGKPSGPRRPERSRTRAGGDRLAANDRPSERYGVLVVARHVKDDGRALILYTHPQDDPK